VPEPVDNVLSGPDDRAAADEVERRVAGAPGAGRGRRVVVDVAEASFVSRHVLAALERGAWSRGTAVEVRSASAETRRVAEALGLRRVLLRGRGPAGYGG
jgi:hypothetical protein